MTYEPPPVHDLGAMDAPVHVVGDVHLTAEEPDVARRFVTWLGGVERGTVVLLGDLFDWWVGRAQAERQPLARAVVEHLQAAAGRGLRLAFVAGNRDYAFDGADGLDIELWPDVVRARWGEKTVVLSHGDLLCSADRAYLKMRALLRSAPIRTLQRLAPYRVNTYLAEGLRDLSTRSLRRNPGAQAGIDYGLARGWLDAYEADALVVGHVHTGVHHRLPGTSDRDVYVLRDWSRAANEVLFDGDTIRLRRLDLHGR